MSTILFVVEGENREIDIFRNIENIFFSGKNKLLPIFVPAGMNIYMLYCKLREDNFETDVVELLRESSEEIAEKLKDYKREDFAEVYYFFDFDEHGNNIPKKLKKDNLEILNEMLTTFDNETESGKLYISYPMIEAVRDYKCDDCGVISGSCFRNRIDFGSYKHDSALETKNNDVNKYDYTNWRNATFNFICRVCCLFSLKTITREEYIKIVNPYSIFMKQLVLYDSKAEIFILSSLLEFLLDYFATFWNSVIGKRKALPLNDSCFGQSEKNIIDD